MSKEKDWSANLGMLDWDSTSIVFTKRSLIEFLKYTGTTVDTNFSNIAKLPRYAKFGKLTSVSEEGNNQTTLSETVYPDHPVSDDLTNFKPTRRVRTAPGGETHVIFGHDEGEDALSSAPQQFNKPASEISATSEAASPVDAGEQANPSSNFKPSRRVRTLPGGQSSLSNLWGTDTPNEDFKPTRRVRQGPGGEDHLNNIF